MNRAGNWRAASGLKLLCCVFLMSNAAASRVRANDTSLSKWLNGELEIGFGVDYSRGDYDESVDTEMVFVPFRVGYLFDDFALTPTRSDQLEFKVTVPYIYIDGAITAGDSGRNEETGIGDITLALAYLYFPQTKPLPAAEVKFKTKLPTANEHDGLGTGRTDYTVGLTLFQRYRDFVPFVTGSYRFIGENEPDYRLRNGATAGAGSSWIISPRYSVGISYDWRQAISKRSEPGSDGRFRLVRADDAHEVTFFGSVRFPYGLRFAPYVVGGLADGSPDFAVGSQLTWTKPLRLGRPGR